VDRRLKPIDRDAERALRLEMYRRLAAGELTIAEAVKAMRRLSHLTQPEFARHRGISVDALRQIESGRGNPTVETLNKVVSVFGLQVGFVPRPRREP
jgi:DNA-binding transcriptional regulator YiaG